ncbi:DUF4157 domain-containing protein [Nocardioides albidus]|uniref:DUF4157 domain-containing protein n=1 Tax=Nocardioides albidus TaxID=1517589 RepID=A0A5C4VW24_9ACTN|nr:DUF4157 domain-containing protein [Nocardioides albidus]TNM39696.1 DUF4157 domain-containing protein [Nocardioides albidus]
MFHHDHEQADAELETGTRGRRDSVDPLLMKAATAGRSDVLGTSGMLGLQRSAGNAAASGVVEEERSPVHDVIAGSGSALDDGVRADMEARIGHDFSDVRVHTGDAADASARSVSAHAYTVGNNIVFQRGSYDPGSTQGQTLLAHELTHVVQQRTGPVDGTPAAGGVSVSDPSDRFEVEAAANAEHVMSRPAPAPTDAVQAAHDDSMGEVRPAVQREAGGGESEEEELQASHDASLGPVQRTESGEAEEEEAEG